MKRVVITGANGLVGSYLVAYLLGVGYEVYAVVRNEKKSIKWMEKYENVKIIFCDLDQIEILDRKIKERGFDIFFHLAWCGSSGNLRKDYNRQLWNAQRACAAAKTAARLLCKKFVGVGSVTELSLRKNIDQDDFIPEPASNYAAAKIVANCMCRTICANEDVDFNWVYMANIYGIGDQSDNIINFVLQSYLKGEEPKLTKGEQLADFIYVSDAARAIGLVGQRGRARVTYYAGGNNVKPLKEFIIAIRDMVEPSLPSGLGKKIYNGSTVESAALDNFKLFHDTGFIPEVVFEDGIKKTYEWLCWKNGQMSHE